MVRGTAGGAAVVASDAPGLTPLGKAAFTGNMEFVEQLVEMRADPTRANDAGQIPLDFIRANGLEEKIPESTRFALSPLAHGSGICDCLSTSPKFAENVSGLARVMLTTIKP